jgi:3-oxoacyl-[acyl-carrier-protein] synthase-3
VDRGTHRYRARHFADDGVFSSDLGLEAAKNALQAAGRSAKDVDLIIVATSTPDMVFPSTACILQNKLGANGGAAFDVQAVCSGFVYALTVADAMIQTGAAKCALVVGAEVFSRILDFKDRTTCVLFGDGAGAVVLEASISPAFWPAICMPMANMWAFCASPAMCPAAPSWAIPC